jgi:selenophosphate synthase
VVDESAVLRWVVDTLDPVVVERVARLKLSRVDLRKALTVVPLGDDLTAVDPETGTVCPGVRVSAPTDDIAVSWPTTDDEEAGR